MLKPLKYLMVLLFSILLSCTEDRVYEANYDFNKSGWPIGEAATFNFEISDNSQYYRLIFNLRHDLVYPYRNIYVHYKLSDSTNSILDKALVNYQVFTPKEGKPLGSGISNIFTYQEVMIDSLLFPYVGKYELEMEQYMRTDSLAGIYSVGIKIIDQPDSAE